VGLLEPVNQYPEGRQGKVLKVKPPERLDAVRGKRRESPLGGVGGVLLEVLHDGVIDPGLDLGARSEKVSPFSSSNNRVRSQIGGIGLRLTSQGVGSQG